MSVSKAIQAVMSDLSKIGIGKDQTNTFDNYKFRGIDGVYNALGPLLPKHGLVILPRIIERETTERVSQKGGQLFHTVLKMEFEFIGTDDDSTRTVGPIYGEAMDRGDKSINKAMSAAFKYAVFQTFCIPTEGDNDADAQTHEVKSEVKPEPAKAGPKHDPMDKDALVVDANHSRYADSFRDALENGGPDEVQAVHADCKNEGEEFYRAVWSLLFSKERSAIKKVIDTKVAA